MLASVDVPVGRTIVIDNGHLGYKRSGAEVVTPLASMGWAGSFNFVVGQTPGASWWLYVNNDAYFEPGRLAVLAQEVETEPLAVRHDKWTVAAITPHVVARVGLLDEWSYFPIYFEDTDYAYRCHLAGVPVRQGDWCKEGDIDGVQDHSITTKSDPALNAANNLTWQLNRAAYVAKWGGPPGREVYVTPWGLQVPVWATRPDPEARAVRVWP
jgi:hypothetical protein